MMSKNHPMRDYDPKERWVHFYEEALEKGMSEEDARRYADMEQGAEASDMIDFYFGDD